MQTKHEEECAVLIQEKKEATVKVVEEAPPVIQETQVIVEDTEKILDLNKEIEKTKVIHYNYYNFQAVCVLIYWLDELIYRNNWNQ